MHIAVRSSVASGIALVGAGAIALSPVQPVASPFSNLPAAISSAGVELTATFDPITPWVDVITAAVTNTVTIGEDWLADPLPAARQLANNWFGYADTTATALGGVAEGTWTYLTTTVPEGLSTAFQQIANGDLSGAASTINNVLGSAIFSIGLPLFPVAEIPGKMADNFAAVVNAVTGISTLFPVVVGLLGPIEGGVQAFGDSAQDVLDAVQAGETVTALNAAFAVVPNVLGAVLNGYNNNVYPGLLTPETGGLLYSLAITIPQAIATALGATTVMAAAAPAASKAAPSAEAVAAAEPTTTDSTAGTARSKVAATQAADDSAGDAAAEPAAAAKPAVKDGNKFEPGDVSGSGAAGARTASASAKASASSSGTAKSGTGAGSGKGHSARGDK